MPCCSLYSLRVCPLASNVSTCRRQYGARSSLPSIRFLLLFPEVHRRSARAHFKRGSNSRSRCLQSLHKGEFRRTSNLHTFVRTIKLLEEYSGAVNFHDVAPPQVSERMEDIETSRVSAFVIEARLEQGN